jgi:ribosomal protein S18 acetylase RimI-like enzyme
VSGLDGERRVWTARVKDISTSAVRCDATNAAIAVDLLVAAFGEDPAWSWIVPDPELRPAALRTLWQAFADNALRYTTLWINDTASAAAVWIPPDGEEMTADQEADVTVQLTDLLGAGAPHAFAAMAEFDDAHPHHEPHFSLSLLGTDPRQRGHGHGLQLLADTLVDVDAARMAAYLEASNPANVALYERYGFERFGAFQLPAHGPTVTTMWRPAQR